MQRYFSNNKENDYFLINKDDLHHIYKVMRMKNNDLIEVVHNKTLFICSLDDEKAVIKEEIKSTNYNKEIILVIPVLKEQKMDLIIQKATELGVSKIIPIKTERSIVKA